MWGLHQGFEWWMPMLGMSMMLIVLVVAGLIAWSVVRLGFRRTEPMDEGDSPIAVLQMRLARGEITAMQFEELQDSLQGSR